MKSSTVNSFESEIEVWLVELFGFKVMNSFICAPLGTFGEWHLLCLFCSRINLFKEVFFEILLFLEQIKFASYNLFWWFLGLNSILRDLLEKIKLSGNTIYYT